MREHWEKFAKENPMHYIATAQDDWDAQEFLASAVKVVDPAMGWLEPNVPRRRVLEIGCGLGRNCACFSRYFDRVDGVDISPAMIEQANTLGLPGNIKFSTVTGSDLGDFGDDTFDLVFSYIVFQHIPDDEVLTSYLSEVSRVLQPLGRAILQYDTRPESTLQRAYKSLPDFLLPRAHRRFIRRYRRDPVWLAEQFERAGLTVVAERQSRTAAHFFKLRRS